MRYLPPSNLANQLWQFGFPDMDAIALAEMSWLSDNSLRDRRIGELLLASPMLLVWSVNEYLQRNRLREVVCPLPESEVEQNIIQAVVGNFPNLIRDNQQSITSVQRVELESLCKPAAFFSLLEQPATPFIEKVIHRLRVVETHLENSFDLGQPLSELIGRHIVTDSTLQQFQNSNLDHSETLTNIQRNWQIEIPFFTTGHDELQRRLERLLELEQDFDNAVETAKLNAMRQLAYGASHEVNNPLANISTRAQALLRDEEDPKRRERLTIIDAQAFRAHDMISNLMMFAKPPTPVFSRLQLKPIVESVVDSLQKVAAIQQTTIVQEVDSAIYFDADPTQLKRILKELIQNALEALRRDGTVSIEAEWNRGANPVKLLIRDDGPGISNEVRQNIFDPFFSGREAGRGLGFGMSVVWRMMQMHRGRVQFQPTEIGAAVELLFPLKQSPEVNIEKTA